MSSFLNILRGNPALIVAVTLIGLIAVVLTLFMFIMRSAGASLRPLVFIAVLMLPLTAVFLIGSLVTARQPSPEIESTFSLAIQDGRFVDRDKLFGVALKECDIRDAKTVFPEYFAQAEHAELGIVGIGEFALVAQFPTADAASRCAKHLWISFQISNTSGDEYRGWRGYRRLNSDYIELLRTGRHVFFWTGPTKDAAAANRARSEMDPQLVGQAGHSAPPAFPALQPLARVFEPTSVKVLGLVLMGMLYVGWFFKGAAWASSAPAIATARPLSADELSLRLEAINRLDVPFRIERGNEPNEFIATWRYADAKWVDLARAHGLRRTFRIRMTLDEKTHTLRATDYAASYDWSAGADGARIQWRAMTGITFFQVEQEKVVGLQLDEQGRPKPELSYTYKFNLAEMKTPLIQTITNAGWTWRPTVWQGPVWLRWLTE